jgi:hypothetical protein
MTAKLLRVGNILEYYGQQVIVLEIKRNSAEFGYFTDSIRFERLYTDSDFPKPMPLTEERLIELGFQPDEEFMGLVLELDNGVSFGISEDNVMYYFGNQEPFWTDILTEIKYLHQLQNLVFALTGTELNNNKV